MTEKKNNDSEFIELIKVRFGATPDMYQADKDEFQFIDERNKLEEETAWCFDAYVENYEKLKKYGLEEKLMRELDFMIRFWLENRTEDFFQLEFYSEFKDHEIVEKAVREYLESKNQ